ncbi:hypothetical protein TrRE_jg7272 [Triparma retinervis]|uniref:Uncharacterized protein n=1 Tax=Triparma retinervis TaxID=2557542 RepID=A0A9W7ADS5_9STRA|nr:hypothetical protein TrRE_jg7272 [Triparma retinervis]
MEYVENKTSKKEEEGGMGEGNGISLDRRYKLPKLKYHGWINVETGEVVEGKDDKEVRDMVKEGKAGTVKQWIRKQGKGEKGIQEVEGRGKKKDEAKNQAKGGKKGIKTPMSSRKSGAVVKLEMEGGQLESLEKHASDISASLEFSDLPKPNPDEISQSQLLMSPILPPPPPPVVSVVVQVKLGRDEGPYAEVDSSAWMCTVGCPGRIKTEVILPYPVDWKKVKATYDAGAGVLTVSGKVLREVEGDVDIGTRAWSLKRALEGERKEDNKKIKGGKGKEDEGGEGLQELPEDRFHKQDIVSQHILEQQAAEKSKKVEKADKERKERKEKRKEGGDDADIEYLDVDDFKPGGKYWKGKEGNEVDTPGDGNLSYYFNEDLKKAGAEMKRGEGTKEEGGDDSKTAKGKPKLNSNLWTELLD